MERNKKIFKQPLVQFFLLTFLFSWLLWLPGVLVTIKLITPGQDLETSINICQWAAGIGPTFAALLLIYKTKKRSGVRDLFRGRFNLKLGRWYFPIFLFVPVMLVLAHLINNYLFGTSFPETGMLSEPWWIPVVFLMFFILQFGEELGWRGYALQEMQKKWNALTSSIILGFIWSVWHLPMFFTKGFGHHDYQLPFFQFMITLILISIIITWLQNNCRGSLIPAFAVHAFINLSGEVLPLIEKNKEVQGDYTVWIILNILLLVCVSLIVKRFGYKKLVLNIKF